MYGSSYIFSKEFFTGWIVVTFIWGFFGAIVITVFPIWESRREIALFFRAVLGQKPVAFSTETPLNANPPEQNEKGLLRVGDNVSAWWMYVSVCGWGGADLSSLSKFEVGSYLIDGEWINTYFYCQIWLRALTRPYFPYRYGHPEGWKVVKNDMYVKTKQKYSVHTAFYYLKNVKTKLSLYRVLCFEVVSPNWWEKKGCGYH